MPEQKKHILIVEDDFELCELLAQAVRDQSDAYDVKPTKNVDEAMAQVRKFQERQRAFDLVITDVKMTGLSGLELLEVLNSVSPETKTIVMTAYNSADLAERAQELNVYAYLTKPFVISEFRRIVQNAIQTPGETTTESTPQLSVGQQRAVEKQLATLRAMTGANVALLVYGTGVALALDSLEPNTKIADLSEALMAAQNQVGQQMSRDLGTDTVVKQSYFGTDTYNICTYQVNESLFVAVVFGPAVKEGQVWYYMRDAAKELALAIERDDQEEEQDDKAGKSVRDELMAMLDQYTQQGRRGARRTAVAETGPEAAPDPPVPDPVEETASQEETLVVDRVPDTALDEIDWNVSVETDWEDVVAETERGFGGLSLEQAQQQGLITPEIIASPDREDAISEEPVLDQGPPVDEINWDVSVDMAWEDLVSGTDQGFTGIGLDEAQQQGIIDNLGQE